METVTIYTNGKSLFTLRNFDKTSGVCHAHGITIKAEVSKLKAMSMHEQGRLFYVEGMGDRKHLAGVQMKKNTILGDFKIF
jgi:hypothetical protein